MMLEGQGFHALFPEKLRVSSAIPKRIHPHFFPLLKAIHGPAPVPVIDEGLMIPVIMPRNRRRMGTPGSMDYRGNTKARDDDSVGIAGDHL